MEYFVMGIRKKESEAVGMAVGYLCRSVGSLEVTPGGDLGRRLSALGIAMVSPMRNILGEGYRPVSGLEKVLWDKFGGGGANDSDDVCTVQYRSCQMLLIEHAGQYFLSDWALDTRSHGLVDTKSLQERPADPRESAAVQYTPEQEAYRAGIVSVLSFSSNLASVRGGERFLEFRVPGMPDAVGLSFGNGYATGKYLPFVAFRDRSRVPASRLTTAELKSVKAGLDRKVAQVRARRFQNGM